VQKDMLSSSCVSGPAEDSMSNKYQFSCVRNMKYFTTKCYHNLENTFWFKLLSLILFC